MSDLKNKVICDNCFNVLPSIEKKSVDMILCDLPYNITANKWDIPINLDDLWKEYLRVIKNNGAMVFTATQPFASKIVMSNLKHYKYEWIWMKQQGTGFLMAKKRPLPNHEQVLVFYKKQCLYNPQFTEGKPYVCKSGRSSKNYYGDVSGALTKNTGKRYPKTIQKFKYDTKKMHPTQKPLALFEYLIKTYTKKGETVLDPVAGVFTTAVACEKLNRNWICIEKNEKYCDIGLKRLQSTRSK